MRLRSMLVVAGLLSFASLAVAESGPSTTTGKPTVTASGLQYWDIKAGSGPAAASGDIVKVHYTGWLTDGVKFDSSYDHGQPLRFWLGKGNVIKGWDEGVVGMKVGGKRQLHIPSRLGYGAKGSGAIPANADLVFDVELIAVDK